MSRPRETRPSREACGSPRSQERRGRGASTHRGPRTRARAPPSRYGQRRCRAPRGRRRPRTRRPRRSTAALGTRSRRPTRSRPRRARQRPSATAARAPEDRGRCRRASVARSRTSRRGRRSLGYRCARSLPRPLPSPRVPESLGRLRRRLLSLRGPDPDRLGVRELARPERGQLAPVTRALDATERQARVRCDHAVHEDAAGFDPACEALAERGIAGPNGRAEAVRGIIGNAHGFVSIAYADDRGDRAEGLLAERRHVGCDTGEDGRPEEVALARDPLATGEHTRSGPDGLIDLTLERVEEIAPRERADLRLRLDRRAGNEDGAQQALGKTGLSEGLLDRERALRHVRRVFEDGCVAGHESWRRETKDLPERKVPRHDREDDPERLESDDAPPRVRANLLVGEVAGGAPREMLGAERAFLDLGLRLVDRLSHLERRQARVAVGALSEERGERAHRDCPFRDGPVAPLEERIVGLGQGHLDLGRRERVEPRADLSGRRMYRLYLAEGGRHLSRG